MVSTALMMAIVVAILGLGYSRHLYRRHQGFVWPNSELITLAIIAAIGFVLLLIGVHW